MTVANISFIKNLILDMDGVLWHGQTPLADLPAFFHTLRTLNINVVLATNNSTSTLAQYEKKLGKLGVEMPASHIITSAIATANYLSHELPKSSRLYVMGGTGLRDALTDKGFVIVPEYLPENPVTAVVVGLDFDVNYKTLSAASLYIRAGAAFYGSNPDTSYPNELGQLPGAGSILAAIAAATGVTPTTIGKPRAIMFVEAMQALGGTVENTAMVGDRLETDILGAQNAGIATILVLSGITNAAMLHKSPIRPDYIFEDIAALAQALKKSNQ